MGGGSSTKNGPPEATAATGELKKIFDAAGNGVVVFSNSYSAACIKAKTLLSEHEVSAVTAIEIDERDDGDELLKQLRKLASGAGGLPSVWAGGRFIGGVNKTKAALEKGGVLKPKEPEHAGGAKQVQDILAAAGAGVVVFSKSFSAVCEKAKAHLQEAGVVPTIIELDEHDDGSKIETELHRLTKHDEVPFVWLAGKYIGDCGKTLEGIDEGIFSSVIQATADSTNDPDGIEELDDLQTTDDPAKVEQAPDTAGNGTSDEPRPQPVASAWD